MSKVTTIESVNMAIAVRTLMSVLAHTKKGTYVGSPFFVYHLYAIFVSVFGNLHNNFF